MSVSKRIYVAASSKELERAMACIGQVCSTPGLTLTVDWTGEFGDTNAPRVPEHELDARTRRILVQRDLHGVLSADFMWLLAPAPDKPTKGAWCELGFATAAYALRGAPRIVVSGEHRYASIFTEVAHEFFEKDMDALAWIKDQP